MDGRTLFDILPPAAPPLEAGGKGLARAGDPPTSHLAAAEVAPDVAALEGWAAGCVRATPGLTAAELWRRHRPAADSRLIGRRLAGCERRGLVRRGAARACGVTGRQAATWWPEGETARSET